MGNLQEESDLNKTIQISARRFEESPYIERTYSPKMVRGVYAGRYFPISIGEDPIEKYWLLRQKALIFDVPEKPVEISGKDAIPFLEKILTRKISSIKDSQLCSNIEFPIWWPCHPILFSIDNLSDKLITLTFVLDSYKITWFGQACECSAEVRTSPRKQPDIAYS